MYHRVIPRAQALAEGEEPGMYVTPDTFARHMQWLRECFDVVSLQQWVGRARNGESLPSKACAITFDDGWRDNFDHAFPVLQDTGTPATVFVVSDLVGAGLPFWPNRLARLLVERPDIAAGHASLAWLRDAAKEVHGGLAGATANADSRSQLVQACKQFSDQWLGDQMTAAESIAQLPPSAARSMMDWAEIGAMAGSGLVDIGSHTCHHYRLREDISPETLRAEIVQSKERIAAHIQRPVTLFCYPNGDYTPEAARLVDSEYDAAVTTSTGINRSGFALNQLKRLGMHEDIGATRHGFFARMSGLL
jgi:peptidoglycan/xylan/chitin deacetylase (PgdA/CDA1 family)